MVVAAAVEAVVALGDSEAEVLAVVAPGETGRRRTDVDMYVGTRGSKSGFSDPYSVLIVQNGAIDRDGRRREKTV